MNESYNTTHRYSISTLLSLRNSPYSKERPTYIDQFKLRGFFRNTDSSNDESSNAPVARVVNQESNSKRRGACYSSTINGVDPRDRIRKENGIILSPQRKSFNMGCQMPSAPNSQIHPSISRVDRGEREVSNRARIGSGRILNRDVSWDYKPPDKDVPDVDYNFRPSGGLISHRDSKDREYEKRFEREKENKRYVNPRYSNHYGNSNSNRQRMQSDSRDDEPEWFSGGPTSQHDTIELRGFDDPKVDEMSPKENDRECVIDNEKISMTEMNKDLSDIEMSNNTNISLFQNQAQYSSDMNFMGTSKIHDSNNNQNEIANDNSNNKESDFNFEEFLKLDSISELLPVSNQACNCILFILF